MHLPGTASLVLLAYLLLFMPWVAIRSARYLRSIREGEGKPAISRQAVWTGTLVSLGVLLLLSWLAGRQFGYRIFSLPKLDAWDGLSAVAALAACFALLSAIYVLRSDAERRSLLVYYLAPRTPRETALWAAAIVAASIAEEAAYRGVGMTILRHLLGSPWPAVAVCAAAFAAAHWVQGWKGSILIFVFALIMHWLVAVTGTLILAMLVHAVYDFAASRLIRREAESMGVSRLEAGGWRLEGRIRNSDSDV